MFAPPRHILPITLLSLGAMAAISAIAPGDAHACDCASICANEIIADDSIAQSTKGVIWHIGGLRLIPDEEFPADAVVLEKQDENGAYLPVPSSLQWAEDIGNSMLVIPDAPFEQGASYRLSTSLSKEFVQDRCFGETSSSSDSHSFTVSADPDKDVRPTLQPGESLHGDIAFSSDGPCSEKVSAVYRDVEVILPQALQEIRDSILLDVEVDRSAYSHIAALCDWSALGQLDQGPDTFRLASTCVSTESHVAHSALAEGDHSVVVRASLPGGTKVWESDPVIISLDCDSDKGGCSTTSTPSPATPLLFGCLGLTGLAMTRRRRRQKLNRLS